MLARVRNGGLCKTVCSSESWVTSFEKADGSQIRKASSKLIACQVHSE